MIFVLNGMEWDVRESWGVSNHIEGVVLDGF